MITFEHLTKPYQGGLLGLTLRLIGYLTGYADMKGDPPFMIFQRDEGKA